MLRWVTRTNKKVSPNNKDKIYGYMSGISITHQDIIKENFKYMQKLQKHLYDFQTHSTKDFIDIENYNIEEICSICLMPLLGPCSTFACDCKMTLHEGCMFRLILGGFNECPQCKLQLSFSKYRPRIHFPKTLRLDLIQKYLIMLLSDETDSKNINIDRLIHDVKKNSITKVEDLKSIYL